MNMGSIKSNNNKINAKENKEQGKYKSAFSLIELSIVLIIIGLLVAGVTGGASLIESAKNRALMNEINGYRQAINSFYAARERLPGDLNNDGCIGYSFGTGCTNEVYTSTSFQAPYNVAAPNYLSAPFIDLYLEKIIDFKPSETSPSAGSGISIPYSNVYKKAYYQFVSSDIPSTTNTFHNPGDIKRFLSFTTRSPEIFDAKLAKKIDEKFDDGFHNIGLIRGNCDGDYAIWGSRTYDNAIANGKGCNAMGFFMF